MNIGKIIKVCIYLVLTVIFIIFVIVGGTFIWMGVTDFNPAGEIKSEIRNLIKLPDHRVEMYYETFGATAMSQYVVNVINNSGETKRVFVQESMATAPTLYTKGRQLYILYENNKSSIIVKENEYDGGKIIYYEYDDLINIKDKEQN